MITFSATLLCWWPSSGEMVIEDNIKECRRFYRARQYNEAIFRLALGASESMSRHDGWVDGGVRDELNDVVSKVLKLVGIYRKHELWDDVYLRMSMLEQGLRTWNGIVHPAYRREFTQEERDLLETSEKKLSADPFDQF